MAVGWTVVEQAYRENWTGSRWENVVDVTIAAEDGTRATLAIPQARYTPDYVRDEANAWYETHVAVRGVSGP